MSSEQELDALVQAREAAIASNEQSAREWPDTQAQIVLGSIGSAVVLFILSSAGGNSSAPLALLAFVAVAVGIVAGVCGAPQVEVPDLPAPKVMVHGDAHFATEEEAAAHGITTDRLAPTDMFLGWLNNAMVRYGGPKSVISIGAAGSGKLATIFVTNLLNMFGCSIIVNDPKGESAAITALWRATVSTVYVLNPFGILLHLPWMKTARFNPLAELDYRAASFAADVGALAKALILQDGKGDSYWTDSARNFVAGVIAYVCSQFGEVCTLPRVNDILHLARAEFLAVMRLMAESPSLLARQAAAPFLEENQPKSLLDTLQTARTQLGSFLMADGIRDVLSGSDFSWRDLKREDVTVYICLPEAESKAYCRFTRLLYASALKALLQLPARPVYMLLDELATSLGDSQLDMVDTAFNLGRGYGVRVHAVFQNWGQAKAVFGERAESIESGAGLVQFFMASDETTFRKMQSRAGKSTLWTKVPSTSANEGTSTSEGPQGGQSISVSQGTSRSESEQAYEVPLVDPHFAYEGLGRPEPGNGWHASQLLFYEGLASPVVATRAAYWVLPDIAWKASPNPFVEESDE